MKIAFRMRGTHLNSRFEKNPGLVSYTGFLFPQPQKSQKSHPPKKKQKELANLVGGFKDFLFSLLFGEDLKFD